MERLEGARTITAKRGVRSAAVTMDREVPRCNRLVFGSVREVDSGVQLPVPVRRDVIQPIQPQE